MTDILAGTAFGQVFSLPLDVSKPKQKIFKQFKPVSSLILQQRKTRERKRKG